MTDPHNVIRPQVFIGGGIPGQFGGGPSGQVFAQGDPPVQFGSDLPIQFGTVGVGDYPNLPQATTDASDWNYNHRRTAQEILPGLYLGPYASATVTALPDLQQKGITHIVCVRQPAERRWIRTNHDTTFKYLVIELEDNQFELIIGHIKKVNAFLDECFAGGGRALIHGNCGLSRAPVFAIAYVMWRHGVSAEVARTYVQSKRFCISPSQYFMDQLWQFEPLARAMHSTPIPLPIDGNGRIAVKREREEDEETDAQKVFKSCEDAEEMAGTESGMNCHGAGTDGDEPMEAQF